MNTKLTVLLLASLCMGCMHSIVEASWWDSSYSYKTEIEVSTGSALSSSYSMHVNMDLDGLVSQNKVRSDMEDVRVVYFDGASYTELDRHIRQASSGYDIWFTAQDSYTANSTASGEYYVYYGNSSATFAPKDYSNVYLFFDDFNGSSLSGQWNGSTSAYTISNSALVTLANYNSSHGIYTNPFPRDSVREYALKVSALSPGQLYVHIVDGQRIVHDVDSTTNTVREGISTILWPHSTTNFDVFQAVILNNSLQYYVGTDYASISLEGTSTLSNTSDMRTFAINDQWTKQNWYMDYLIIRDNVAVAPTLLTGAEIQGGGAVVVPEPLSICCLLMSLAGIALKRKK